MTQTVTPMIHVPDIRKTVRWYESIGFQVIDIGEDAGEAVWAMVSFGSGRVMFNIGGEPGAKPRREVDLYVETAGVDEMLERLRDRVEIVEDVHDTFYGMREFIIRDINGFWITFGEPIPKSGD